MSYKNILYIGLLILFLNIGMFITYISIDSNIINYELLSLSIILFFIITVVLILVDDYFTPIIFFSLLFYGYVFSGIYFSFYSNFEYARFFNLVDNPFTIDNFIIAQISVIVGYVFFILGISIINNIKIEAIKFTFNNFNLNSKIIRNILFVLFSIGFIYWIYISFKVANGPIDLLSKLGIFHSILKEGLTTLPYHLSYIGSTLLFLYYLGKGRRIPILIKIVIILTFLMLVSKARLSGAVFYLGSFFVMYSIYYNIKIDLKKIIYVLLFFIFLIILYMLRYYSVLSYIDAETSEPIFELLGRLFFGRTNIGDLQSIVFSYEYIGEQGYLFGSSFFDFTRFWIDRLFHISIAPNSIGMRLKEVYFDTVSGAPAPGIISEVIMNFGFMGITFGMLFVGIFIGLVSKLVNPLKSKLNLLIYAKFLFFILILPKVDSSSLQGFIWALLPIGIFIFIAIVINTILKGITNADNSFNLSTSKI